MKILVLFQVCMFVATQTFAGNPHFDHAFQPTVSEFSSVSLSDRNIVDAAEQFPAESYNAYTQSSGSAVNDSVVAESDIAGSGTGSVHTMACSPDWKYATLENKIGPRLLNSLDIDNDGITEIIGSTPNYWYVLKYDPVRDTVDFDYISGMYEQGISCFAAFDSNHDSISEIFVGVGGDIYMYDGLSKALTLKLNCTSQFGRLLDMEYGDADNDGAMELVCSDYSNIYIINTDTYSLEQVIPYGDYDFEIGNVDADPFLEIVTCHGKVLQNVAMATTLEWQYSTTNISWEYHVHLSDIDNDGMEEIVLMNEKKLSVYDADLKASKYEIAEDWKILQFIMKDVNNDGVAEIVYGGDSYDIICVDAVTKQQLWILDSYRTLDAVNIFDVDGDGALDVIWFAGGTAGNAELIGFRVADMGTQQLKYRSYQVPGRFDQIAAADIDNDGSVELIVLNASEKVIDENMMIFDAATHQLEWLSPPDFFSVNGHYLSPQSFMINDIDKDGTSEIVLIGGSGSAVIAYMNGVTKQIEQYHLYNNAPIIGDFGQGTIADVDNDGADELIVSSVARYYIINPSNFSIEYESAYFFPNVFGQLRVSNIDSNDENEIVYLKQKLYVIGGQSHIQKVIAWKDFSVFDLYDINSDGTKEIVVGTDDGYVYTLSGDSLQQLSEIHLSSKRITALRVADLNGDSQPEIIATSDGQVIIYSDSLHSISSVKYDQSAMDYDGLIVSDMNNDLTKEILFGGTYQLNQLTDACYRCMWFDTGKAIESVSCGNGPDGSIALSPAGGQEPYSFLWNTGATVNPLINLAPGTYQATITDNLGCVLIDTSVVKQAVLTATYVTTNESCMPATDGSALVNITKGTEPVTFVWNNGSTSAAILNQVHGQYTVSVHDAKNCFINQALTIAKDTLVLQHTQNDVACNGYHNGSISVTPSIGSPPYTYLWNTGGFTGSISSLPAAIYTVDVVDAHGCRAGDSITIIEPAPLVTVMQSTPDFISTLFGDGTASVLATGGTPPYAYKWSDPLGQLTPVAINLINGTYTVRVKDANFCAKVDTVVVEATNSITEPQPGHSIISAFPNPTTGPINLTVSFNGQQDLLITVYDSYGQMLSSLPFKNSEHAVLPIDLSGLASGCYTLIVRMGTACSALKVQVIK